MKTMIYENKCYYLGQDSALAAEVRKKVLEIMKKTVKMILKSAGIGGSALAAATYSTYNNVFSVDKKRISDPHHLPKGEQYEQLREKSLELIDQSLAIPYQDVYTYSEDGYRLHAKYYETIPGAPVEILFHGYRSMPIRDFCGGLQLALAAGHNALLVDERAHGESEGRCLTFGIMERKDCLSWIHFVKENYGEETPIVLVGISMGASTVLMATELALPENVKGVIADSSYTSPKEIICKVSKDRKYPVRTTYPLIKAAARIWGKFDLEAASAEEALKKCRIPVLLIHGEEDHFVPCEMSKKNYEICASEKELLIIPGAGHGLGYMLDYDAYTETVRRFLEKIMK